MTKSSSITIDTTSYNALKLREKRNVALSSIIAALVITGLKLAIGLYTNSLGILSEAAHSGLDLIAAVMTFFAVSVSDRSADAKHPYGHGKVENISALLETLLLLLTCGWIIWEAVARLKVGGTHVETSIWGFAVIIFSIIVDYSRSRALQKTAVKYNSQALEADALHFSSDIWSSGVVLFGLFFTWLGYGWIDSVAALSVAIMVLVISVRLGMRTIDALMDSALPEKELKWIEEYLKSLVHPVTGFHALRTRMSGNTRYIELHLELVPEMTLADAHRVGDDVSHAINQHFPGSSIIVHLDPDCDEEAQPLS